MKHTASRTVWSIDPESPAHISALMEMDAKFRAAVEASLVDETITEAEPVSDTPVFSTVSAQALGDPLFKAPITRLSLMKRRRIAAMRYVARKTGVTGRQMMGRSRRSEITNARQWVWYLLFKRGSAFAEIGQAFDRDHTTIMHGVRRHRERVGAA